MEKPFSKILVAGADDSIGSHLTETQVRQGYDEISLGDTLRLIAEVMNAAVEISTDEARLRQVDSTVERLWAANDKAARLINIPSSAWLGRAGR